MDDFGVNKLTGQRISQQREGSSSSLIKALLLVLPFFVWEDVLSFTLKNYYSPVFSSSLPAVWFLSSCKKNSI
jgi:hypothetical protein